MSSLVRTFLLLIAEMLVVLFNFLLLEVALACQWSPTTVSGSKKPSSVCSGQLIFEDNFNSFEQSKWQHEITLAGGGNWEYVKFAMKKAHKFYSIFR